MQLNWTTTQERNNAFFEVEKLSPNNKWEAIGKLPAKVNVDLVNVYEFLDLQPINGNNMYRLKQVDDDGTFT